MALRSKAVIPGDAPAAWGRFEYPRVQVPAKGGGIATVRRPALAARARHPDRAPGEAEISIRADAWLDTGADASVMPMWLVQQAGIPIDKGAKRKAYSVSGTLWAYGARAGWKCGAVTLGLTSGCRRSLCPTRRGRVIPTFAARLCWDRAAFLTGFARALTTRKKSFGSECQRMRGRAAGAEPRGSHRLGDPSAAPSRLKVDDGKRGPRIEPPFYARTDAACPFRRRPCRRRAAESHSTRGRTQPAPYDLSSPRHGAAWALHEPRAQACPKRQICGQTVFIPPKNSARVRFRQSAGFM